MDTSHDYLMNIATGLYLICYIPELYANYKNKNANFWNVPEKVLIFVGTTFALVYAAVNQDDALIINYGPLFLLDGAALGMRAYYACRNRPAHPYQVQVDAKSSIQDSKYGGSPDDSRETAGPHTPQV